MWTRSEFYFLGTSGDETEPHLLLLLQHPWQQRTAALRLYVCRHVFCLFISVRNVKKTLKSSDLTWYHAFAVMSLHDINTTLNRNKTQTVWFIEWKENWSIFILPANCLVVSFFLSYKYHVSFHPGICSDRSINFWTVEIFSWQFNETTKVAHLLRESSRHFKTVQYLLKIQIG